MTDSNRYDEFARLVRLHTSQMLGYINSLLLDWNDADDLFQETCVVLWQKFDEFKPGTNFLAWALRIADYKVAKFQTKQTRHFALAASLRDTLKSDFARRSPDESTTNLTALSGCMDRLSQDDQRILKLCYVESIPIRQIASAFGRPPKGIEKSLYRIRSWLLDCIRREINKADVPPDIHRVSVNQEDRP